MTINEVIAIVDHMCPNSMEKKEKIRHLSILDQRVINEVLSGFPESTYDRDFKGYATDDTGSTALLVDSPYDQMYVHWLLAQIYLMMLEQGHYNNQLYLFNGIYEDFKVNCYRTMRPSGGGSYKTR